MQLLKGFSLFNIPCTQLATTGDSVQPNRKRGGGGRARISSQNKILQYGLGFIPIQCLYTAVDFDLYTILADKGALTTAEIIRECGLHGRGVQDFLDTLVSMDLLLCEGRGESRFYMNTIETGRWLDRNQSENLIPFFRILMRQYKMFMDLPHGLRTGQSQSDLSGSGKTILESLAEDKNTMRAFAESYAGLYTPCATKLAETFNFGHYPTICEVGGQLGAFSAVIAAKHPHLLCKNADLPFLKDLSKEYFKKKGVSANTYFIPLDFVRDDLPAADVMVFGHVLCNYTWETNMKLLRKAYKALTSGGVCIVYEPFIDDDRKMSLDGLMMSLVLLMETPEGAEYTFADVEGWMSQQGFINLERRPLIDADYCIIGHKP